MFWVILCLITLLPTKIILAQKFNYLPPYLYSSGFEHNQEEFNHHEAKAELQRTHRPVVDLRGLSNPSLSLSKFYKPRPTELERFFREYERGKSNILREKQNKILDAPAYTKHSRIPSTKSHDSGKFSNDERSFAGKHSQFSYRKQSADINKKNYYSRIKPIYATSKGLNDLDTGYKTTEETYEEEMPSNYGFSYVVSHPFYGINFGHKESKEGELAKGLYYTLLPDGRTQYVEYEADGDGYKPKITYDDAYQNQYR